MLPPRLHPATPADRGVHRRHVPRPAASPGWPADAAARERLAAMTAPSGLEQRFVDSLLAMWPAARRDSCRQRGRPARLRLAEAARRVSGRRAGVGDGGIGADGWLTLRRLAGRVPALFDQQLERRGHGLDPQRSGARGRRGEVGAPDPRPHAGRRAVYRETAYVDVGARTEEEARALRLREDDAVALASGRTDMVIRSSRRLVGAPLRVRGARDRGRCSRRGRWRDRRRLRRRAEPRAARPADGMNEAGPFAETIVSSPGAARRIRHGDG